jgi:hypothetical protein
MSDSRRSSATCSSFIHVHRNIYLALYDHAQAKRMAEHELNHNFLVLPLNTSTREHARVSDECAGFMPSSLAQIYRFDQMVREISRKNAGAKLVFCSGVERLTQMKTAFLIGTHLIMTHCVDPDGISSAFQPMSEILDFVLPSEATQLSIRNCWSSLASAKEMNWLDFWEIFDTGNHEDASINLDEYSHYAR